MRGRKTEKTDSGGYVRVLVPEGHPLRMIDGYAMKHRIVMSETLGRWVLPEEDVHHKNEDTGDNSPGNLEVRTTSEHCKMHRPWEHLTEESGQKIAMQLQGVWKYRPDVTVERAIELRDMGLGLRTIARLLGCTRSTVKCRFREWARRQVDTPDGTTETVVI